MVRLYWNRRGEKKHLVWSVDKGTQDTETLVRGVTFEGVNGNTEDDLLNVWPKPAGWVIFKDSELEVKDDWAYIRRKRTEEPDNSTYNKFYSCS